MTQWLDSLGVVLARRELAPLLAAPLLAVGLWLWARRARARAWAQWAQPEIVERLRAMVSMRARLAQAALSVAVLTLLALAALRPQVGGTARVVRASGVDLVLVVDYSKSMMARDVAPSRTRRLEAELSQFIAEIDARGDRVGVVVFAGAARGMPLSRDTEISTLYLRNADPRSENPGGTAIGRGLALAIDFLVDARREQAESAREPRQAIVLFTDGEDTDSNPQEAAEQAAKLGIKIFTVGIGSASGEPVQRFTADGEPDGYVQDDQGNYVMTRLDEALLQQLASQTGGAYVHVTPSAFGLDGLRDALSGLQAEAHTDLVEVERDEAYAWLVAPAVLLLSVMMGLRERRGRAT